MCGRYAAILPADHIAALFQVHGPIPEWAGTWNMAPTRDAPVIRLHPETGQRHLNLLRWGLVPHWVKDPKTTRQPINARRRDHRLHRHVPRCLRPPPLSGARRRLHYESAGRPAKANFPGRSPAAWTRRAFVFAGLWEGWRGPDGSIIRSFTIVTTSANSALRPLHERMPVVLEEADWPKWLGEEGDNPASLIRPSEAEFRTWRVGTAVNNVRHDAASLLDPVESPPG